MEQMKEKEKVSLNELSKEELEKTSGGSWWEVRAINGDIYFIFHLYDEY